MIRSAILILLVAMLPLISRAQGHTVTGKVVNRHQESLMGNVIALSPADSAFVKGAAFLEGVFELSGLNANEVLIKLTSLQFKDTVFRVMLAGARVDLGTITVSTGHRMLQEVEVMGTMPLFNTRPDGVTEVNVANTVLETSSSVAEILARSPNVISNEDGIAVFGKGQAVIYLNGKRIPQERLSSLSANQVKSIEIIANPSAAYDAEGRAVINIITKDDLPEGYRASAQQQVSWSERAGTMGNTMLNVNYRRRKLDVAGNYGLKLGNDRETLYTTRVRPDEDEYLNSDLIWDRKRNYKNVSIYSLGASYDLGGKGYASLEYNGSYEKLNDFTLSRNNIITLSENGIYTTHANSNGLNRNSSLTLNLQRVLDTLGSTLFAGGQYSRFKSSPDDYITETNVVNNENTARLLASHQHGDITVFNPQVDVVKAFATGRLGAGVKLSRARAVSDLRFYIAADQHNYALDEQRSNDFDYRETVPAAYVQYDGVFSASVTYTLGARTEWTRYSLFTTAQNLGTIKKDYVNVFPNAQVTVALAAVKLRAAYTSRITRPQYQALSPSLYYQDAFTSIEGNPNLRPEKTHSFELGASRNAFDLKAGYNYTIDPMSGAALRGNDEKSYVLKRFNFYRGYSYYTALSASLSTRWLTSTNTLSVTYTRMTDHQYGYEEVGSRPQLYGYTSNKINVGHAVTVHILAWYLGERYYGIRYDKPTSIVTLGLEKEFFNRFLKCTFTANDIFHKSNPAGYYTVGQTLVTYNRLYNTRYFRVSLICTLGQLNKSGYKSRSTGEAENSRAR